MSARVPSPAAAVGSVRLHRSLTVVEYFTFGFGSMVGVGWLLLMDDWLGRGGPLGAMLGFLVGGLLLLPIGHTYGRLVRQIQDAGAEIAYAEGIFPHFVTFAFGWTMVLAYAIVCPWEAVAIGNVLARLVPAANSFPLYVMGGKTIYAPRLVVGLLLTWFVTTVNYRGIHLSGIVQNITTFGLLAIFAIFSAMGFARGSAANLQPLFSHAGSAGVWLSILLVVQIVPYFMTGFESVAKGSEEAREDFDPQHFSRAIYSSLIAGVIFYVTIVAVVSYVYPWQGIVSGQIGTEIAFERAFGSRAIAQFILAGAFLSLLKIFNGNFVAASRLIFAMGRRRMVHPALAAVHPVYGTPRNAVLLLAVVTALASMLGDAILVPVTDVGSLAVGVGWFSACVAYLIRTSRGDMIDPGHRLPAYAGAMVSLAIVAMKVVPAVPGSFTRPEWTAFIVWSGMGLLLWVARPQVR